MYEGCIVEYIDQNRFICSVCLQDKGGKLRLLTRMNREVNLSSKRPILISTDSMDPSSSREILLEKLREADETRINLQTAVKPPELWELIHDQKESFDHRYLANLVFGDEISDAHISAVVRALFEDRIYFKLKESRFLPNSPERVEELIRQREEEAARKIILHEGSAWIRDVIKGTLSDPPGCREEVIELLTTAALYGQDAPDAKFAAELISKSGMSTLEDGMKILVALGVWEEDENLDLIREGINETFSDPVQRKADSVAADGIETSGREDMRDLSCLTIDGALTKDFDDALSVQQDGTDLLVGVHITDVASVIHPGSLLDKEAMSRVSSLYLPRRQIPMLPRILSEDVLSLVEGEDRLSLSLICRFDPHGVLLDSRFAPSIIRVGRQLLYEEVNGLLDGGDEDLEKLHGIARSLRRGRFSNGALDLTLPDVAVGFDEGGRLTLRLYDQDTPARLIVEELMILYNHLAARWCRDRQIPVLYRAQAPPSERLSEEADERMFYIFQQLRKLSPLHLDINPLPHSGLGLEIYTQCTSPMRRYLDLLVQQQIIASLRGTGPPHNSEDIENIRMSAEPALRRMSVIKRNRLRYWVMKYMAQNSERRYRALVLNDTRNKYRILIKDVMLVSEVRKQPSVQFLPGQEASVRVIKIDPWRDMLELEFTSTENL